MVVTLLLQPNPRIRRCMKHLALSYYIRFILNLCVQIVGPERVQVRDVIRAFQDEGFEHQLIGRGTKVMLD